MNLYKSVRAATSLYRRSFVLLLSSPLVLCAVARASDEMPPAGLKSQIPELSESKQLILVTVDDWDNVSAQLHCFERSDRTAPWTEAFPRWEAVIGKHGLAWGIGLHGTHPGMERIKREGDGRAPAGVFALGEAFGYSPPADAQITRFPYRQLTSIHEGVDDPQSRYYNRIVDTSVVSEKDWTSAEKMLRSDDLYRWGAVVWHNRKPYPGYGSCIFLHVWKGPGQGTSGCTAMSVENIQRLLGWLNQENAPVLVQLPQAEYVRLKAEWILP